MFGKPWVPPTPRGPSPQRHPEVRNPLADQAGGFFISDLDAPLALLGDELPMRMSAIGTTWH
jgi:hypothetical protein